MRKLLVLALMLTACQGSQEVSEISPLNDATQVIGGTDVPLEDSLTRTALSLKVLFDPVVKETEEGTLTTYRASQCTASALGPRLILTAAHCVSKTAEIHKIELNTPEGEVEIEAENFVAHPDYNAENKVPDLALILLKEDLPLDVQIVQLPPPVVALNLTSIQAAGFGRMEGKRSLPGKTGVLRATNLNVLNYAPTSPFFQVDQTQGRGVCQGDSGGPALTTLDGKLSVVGVVSKTRYVPVAEGDGEQDYCNYRGEYVNVQFYLDWLVPAMKTLSSPVTQTL
ncbi:trypsin-like serine protease [Bdellovibrio sp. 22V]|uniref:S1 family peptidase n=1 Tax=Bdellovibrio TaxID=958 RepID=UPI002543089C|nr:trypsin-like serine protease [Bdellovibrio sp. 22V]WII72410.1 trypsin-like serine protease [Bdellovibrio sp. 22V]